MSGVSRYCWGMSGPNYCRCCAARAPAVRDQLPVELIKVSSRHKGGGMDRFWLKSYPPGTPADIDPNEYASISAMIEQSLGEFRDHTAFVHMGRSFSYAELDRQSAAFGAWLQAQGLKRGD